MYQSVYLLRHGFHLSEGGCGGAEALWHLVRNQRVLRNFTLDPSGMFLTHALHRKKEKYMTKNW